MTQYEWEPAGSHNPWGKKRVRRTHCSKGHEFTDENTFVRSHDKARVCRECRKEYARKKYQENKSKNLSQPRLKKNKEIDMSYLIPSDPNVRSLWYNLQVGLKDVVTPCQENDDSHRVYSGEMTHTIDQELAERLCYGCPLIMECYQYANAADESWGIWGGVNFSKEELINVDE